MAYSNEYRDSVYRRCISEYGTQPQVDMCIEEMSELTKALLKWRRKFMCRQMELMFQAEDEVSNRIDFKVGRQVKRLDERSGSKNE